MSEKGRTPADLVVCNYVNYELSQCLSMRSLKEVEQESVSGRAETLLRDPMPLAPGIHSLCALSNDQAFCDVWEHPEHMLVN